MLTNRKINTIGWGFATTKIPKFILCCSIFSNHSNYLIVWIVDYEVVIVVWFCCFLLLIKYMVGLSIFTASENSVTMSVFLFIADVSVLKVAVSKLYTHQVII